MRCQGFSKFVIVSMCAVASTWGVIQAQQTPTPAVGKFESQAKALVPASEQKNETAKKDGVRSTAHDGRDDVTSPWQRMIGSSRATRRGPSAVERLKVIRRRLADEGMQNQEAIEIIRTPSSVGRTGQLPEVPRHAIGVTQPTPASTQPTDQPPLAPTVPSGETPQSQLPIGEQAIPVDSNFDSLEEGVYALDSAPIVETSPNLLAEPGEPQEASPSDNSAFRAQQPTAEPLQRQQAVLLQTSGPAIAVNLTGLPRTVLGKPAPYTVTATNRGDVAAQDVVVHVNVPNWMEIGGIRSTTGTARNESDGSENTVIQWKLRQLGPQSSEQLVLNLIPRDGRAADLNLRWTYSPAEALAQIEVQEPKLQMHLAGPSDVMYGETNTYTITLSNPGTGDAENVVLNLLPVSPNAETAGAREIGILRAGERRAIEIELTAHQAGRLQVRAQAYADGGLRSEAAQDVMVRRANLQVAAAGPPMKYAGTNATYKVRVANTGDASAADVVLNAVLPAGAKYISSTDGGKIDVQQGQVVWNLGTLRHGAQRILELTCQLTSSGDNRLDVRTSGAGDLSAARSIVTQVEALADLKLHINDPKGAVPVGTEVVYEVTIVNRGSKAAENVDIVAFFSEGVEPTNSEGWRGEVSPGQVVFDRVSRINVGQEMGLKILARADRAGTHRIRVQVNCDNPETELASEESTKFYGDAGAAHTATLPSIAPGGDGTR